jgi:hypothetical protein
MYKFCTVSLHCFAISCYLCQNMATDEKQLQIADSLFSNALKAVQYWCNIVRTGHVVILEKVTGSMGNSQFYTFTYTQFTLSIQISFHFWKSSLRRKGGTRSKYFSDIFSLLPRRKWNGIGDSSAEEYP